jgi:hypothetical protein
VDGSQVGVLEQGDEVSLSGLLKSHDGGGLETQVGLWSHMSDHETRDGESIAKTDLEVLSNLTNETLERQLADQEFGRLLVTPDRQGCVSYQSRWIC